MTGTFSLLSACSGPFNWYGFIIGTGMIICLVGAYFVAKKRGYYKDIVFDIAILCIPLAIVGARLYYVIFDIVGNGGHWTFKEILGIGTGGLSGLAIYGGLIGSVIGGIILHFIKHKKEDETQRVNFWQIADLGFTFIILGQAIGRWGNFANQEAYGPKVNFNFFPITVHIDAAHGVEGEGYYLATFFYESLWNIIGFGLLLWLYLGKRKSFDGFILSSYCIYYGIGRLWIEGLRTDSLYTALGLRVSQVVSILIILFGIGFIVAHLYRARSKGLKPFIFIEETKLDESYLGYRESILHHPNDYSKPAETKENDYNDEFYSEVDEGFDEKSDPSDDSPDGIGDTGAENGAETGNDAEEESDGGDFYGDN